MSLQANYRCNRHEYESSKSLEHSITTCTCSSKSFVCPLFHLIFHRRSRLIDIKDARVFESLALHAAINKPHLDRRVLTPLFLICSILSFSRFILQSFSLDPFYPICIHPRPRPTPIARPGPPERSIRPRPTAPQERGRTPLSIKTNFCTRPGPGIPLT